MVIDLELTMQEGKGVGIVDYLSKKLYCKGNESYIGINSYLGLRKSSSLMIET